MLPPMAEFPTNPTRLDPCKNFKFRVKWDGAYIPAISRVTGLLVRAYKVYRCWPSQYRALPDLDAGRNAIAIEHIKLENEGWERDTSVIPQVQP